MSTASPGDRVGSPTYSSRLTGKAEQMANEIASPIPPPTAVRIIVSSMNWVKIALLRAPSAILMPISRVRSSTTTFMMLETPMPPTTRVNTPMMPRKIWKPSMKASMKTNISVVSQTWTAWSSSGWNRNRLLNAALTCSFRASLSSGVGAL